MSTSSLATLVGETFNKIKTRIHIQRRSLPLLVLISHSPLCFLITYTSTGSLLVMTELQFSYRLGNVRECFQRKGLVSMRNHPSYTFLFFWGLPTPNQLIFSLPNSPPMILPGKKSLMIHYKKFGNIFLPSTAWNLSFLRFWGLQNTAVKLLFCSKKENWITLTPVRLLSQKPLRGNYSLITYSGLLFIPWLDSQLV